MPAASAGDLNPSGHGHPVRAPWAPLPKGTVSTKLAGRAAMPATRAGKTRLRPDPVPRQKKKGGNGTWSPVGQDCASTQKYLVRMTGWVSLRNSCPTRWDGPIASKYLAPSRRRRDSKPQRDPKSSGRRAIILERDGVTFAETNKKKITATNSLSATSTRTLSGLFLLCHLFRVSS